MQRAGCAGGVAIMRPSLRPSLQGLVGVGVAGAETQALAVSHAHMDAYNRLTTIPLYRNHTIDHAIDHHFHGSLKA